MERTILARPRGGFTLIELLIVIAIITILASGLVVAVVGVVDRTKKDKTEATLNILQTALNTYKNAYGKFPPVYGGPGHPGGTGSSIPTCADDNALAGLATTTYSTTTVAGSSAANRAARNRAIRVYLEAPWSKQRDAPFIKGSDQIGRGLAVNSAGASDSNGVNQYVDGWGLALVFNRPGHNHAYDVDSDNKPIKGRYDTSGTAGNESRWVFDVYSFGSDNVDSYGASHTNAASNNNQHGDDVVSWGLNVAE